MGWQDDFRGKRITLMGLGLLGRGQGDAAFLASLGARVLVTDRKPEEELRPAVDALRAYPSVSFRLGGHDEKDFTECDMVIKAAGAPLTSPFIAAARQAGVPVMMSTALFARYAREIGATIVGVTGTRGKSTTTHMIRHSLQRAGRKTHLGGNVRGVSTLALLPDVMHGDIAVLELDSWQLQGFAELRMSPNVAVFTNLMPDHLNYYPSMEVYFDDKAAIFLYQREGDTLIVGEGVAERVRAARPPLAPIVPPPIPREWNIRVPGEHNRENASLARGALAALGLSEEEIRDGLASFEGVEGRLQLIREIGGMRIYNDNNATTPEATIAGLRALGSDITLIAGGSDKGLPLEELVTVIKEMGTRVVLLSHPAYAGTTRLAGLLKQHGVIFDVSDTIVDALACAAKKGHTILFSPAFASFGMFKNEYDRNDEFASAALSL